VPKRAFAFPNPPAPFSPFATAGVPSASVAVASGIPFTVSAQPDLQKPTPIVVTIAAMAAQYFREPMFILIGVS
jgi:hypothetical protein